MTSTPESGRMKVMNTETLIAEFQKLPPDQKQVVKEFVLADTQNGSAAEAKQVTLFELFSDSPFARLDFEVPEPVRSPIRPVEL